MTALNDFLEMNGLPSEGDIGVNLQILLNMVDSTITTDFERSLSCKIFELALDSILTQDAWQRSLVARIQEYVAQILRYLDDVMGCQLPAHDDIENHYSKETLYKAFCRYRVLIVNNFRIPNTAHDSRFHTFK